jgi:hypothetical protein
MADFSPLRDEFFNLNFWDPAETSLHEERREHPLAVGSRGGLPKPGLRENSNRSREDSGIARRFAGTISFAGPIARVHGLADRRIAGAAVAWRRSERGLLRVTQTVYEGYFDEPKSPRSRRSIPLDAKSIEILSARWQAGLNPEALVFRDAV